MELTRRTFVAGAAAGTVLVASGALFGCTPEENTPSQVAGSGSDDEEEEEEVEEEEVVEEEESEETETVASGSYTPGTYTATATGIGEVTVTVTFDETSITACEVDASNETATIGGAAADTLEDQVLEAQSADIDGVSGATLTSTAVMTAVADCIAQATASSDEEEESGEAIYTPGTYTGEGTGISSTVTVTITFDETSMTEVVVDSSGETATIGAAAQDELAAQVLEAQSADIDGVSGATITSSAVIAAVESCIAQATAASDEEAEEEEESGEAIYTPGTYTGEGTGISSTVTVTITFDETSMTEVVVDSSGETATIGAAAQDELAAQVLEAQSADIDGVSGATITSSAVIAATESCIEQATAGAADEAEEEEEAEAEEEEEEAEAEETTASGSYVAGEYSAAALGYGFLKVTVTFDETSIIDVYVDASNESEDIGQEAAVDLEEQVLEAQSADIEGVSGATLTSTAVKNAVINCIAQAQAD